MSESGLWNELTPEVFGAEDHPVLRTPRGSLILVRVNTCDSSDRLVSHQILAGRLIRANRSEGFVLELVGTLRGELLFLPLVPEAFKLCAPGTYMLSDGTGVRDPLFVAAFDIYPEG